jgi:hypothetical protein
MHVPQRLIHYVSSMIATLRFVATRDGSETIKNYAQVLAWLGGGAYLGLKAFQGFFVVDMSLCVKADRSPSPIQDRDRLLVSVELKRGVQGTFKMHDAVVILVQGTTEQVLDLGIERFQSIKRGRNYKINPEKFAKEVPKLNLAPGDSTCLTALSEIEKDEPCRVEVVVIGTKFFSNKRAQWRASTTSLPCANKK